LLCDAKKVEAKINIAATPDVDISAFERKVKFLTEELNDIRNNKVNRRSKLLDSLKLYLNWLKTNSQVKSELLKNPLDVDFKTIEETKSNQKWWISEDDKLQYEANQKIAEVEKKIDRSYLSQLETAAKSQHFATDIQKSVFYTLMSSDDYLDAFQNLQKLGLKKKQEREIIKVILHCQI
jgi:nucleolar MIF4G domain-containing protein 1